MFILSVWAVFTAGTAACAGVLWLLEKYVGDEYFGE
jgi:hypothetical protein